MKEISIKTGVHLLSTLSGEKFAPERFGEYAPNGESLEVFIPNIEKAHIRKGEYLWQRFYDFLPFDGMGPEISLGEGNTALMAAPGDIKAYCGIEDLSLKNETSNPTWSFKDRGSLTCVALSRAMKEKLTATISTGNMGHSLSAYGAKAGLRVLVFVPSFTSAQKIAAMGIHGAEIFRVRTDDYAEIKKVILALAEKQGLRAVTGNGPFRVEGYKLTAFEIYEQTRGKVPEYILVPSSACGHIRGLFKGFVELKKAALIRDLPKMILVQAENCSPIVTSVKEGLKHVKAVKNLHTIAGAISSCDPPGGDEILDKAYRYGWPVESVSEEEILFAQGILARAGYFVEPAAATSLIALKKLRKSGKVSAEARVLMMLTGAGLKDMEVLKQQSVNIRDISLGSLEKETTKLIKNA